MFTMFDMLTILASQNMGVCYFEIFQSLRLMIIVLYWNTIGSKMTLPRQIYIQCNIWIIFGLLKSTILEIKMHKHITHIQRHMNNVWKEMVSCSFCSWGKIHPSWINLSALFWTYSILYLLDNISIDYEQNSALPSTILSSITFILITNNLML
jgi:hypothetical protein